MTVEEFMTMTVTQSFMGKVLGLSQQRISQLLDEGILIRDEVTGRLAFYDSLKSYWLSKNATGDTVNFWKERGLHEKAKRELSELKLAERRGELYEAATVEAVLSELLITFRNRLQGVGHKLAARLVNETAAQISQAIDAEISDILAELSEGVGEVDYGEEFAGAVDGELDPDAAPDGELLG